MKYLIVVDMQNDFIDGSLGSPEAQAIVPNVENKILEYLNHGAEDDIYFTRDTHGEYYLSTMEGKNLPVKHCTYGTHGWQIISQLHEHVNSSNCIINKYTFGYDNWENVIGNSKYIESIELVGVCTDICVVSNALILKSLYPEIEIIVDASCCAGTTPENHRAAIQVMKSCQINIINE